MNLLKTLLILIVSYLKKAVSWYTNPENAAKVKMQLEILSEARKFYGKKTTWKSYTDVANDAVAVSKTIKDIMDGQSDEENKRFVEVINKDNKKLKGLGVGLADGKINVSFGGFKTSYDPSNGGVSFGATI